MTLRHLIPDRNKEVIFTPARASERYGIPVSTLRFWIRTGSLKASRVGGRWYIPVHVIENALGLSDAPKAA